MCGIAGIYRYKNDSTVSEEEIQQMLTPIHYRGPDGDGVYTHGPIGLGHKRLTIIDTSERSNQPMISQNGTEVLSYNGEVYNYVELSTDLIKKGVNLRTSSDTEIILESLRLQGVEALHNFNGMFAFAFWNPSENELLLARDRVGIKPLYYKETKQGIIFSSEIKSILAIDSDETKVNRKLIDSYMSLGYCTGNETLFQDIKKVPPGHYLQVKDGTITLTKYWDIKFQKTKDLGKKHYIKKTQDLFEDAVKLQLRSDVPLGVFLSGGIDSSAVVAMMSKMGVKDIKTFSVAWDYGKDFDETQYARQVSRQFNTDHTEYFMTAQNFKDFLPEYIRHMDEPVTEAAAISLYYLALKTKEKVTVVLSGEGSDEVFGGYPIYKYMDIISKYKKIPKLLRSTLNPALRKLGKTWSKYADLSEVSLEESYAGVSFYETKQKNKLYTDKFQDEAKNNNVFKLLKPYYESVNTQDNQTKMQNVDIKTWLVDDLLIKADRMSMAASLELRVPFLDHRFLEFAGEMPSKYRHKNYESKYIIKKAMEPYLDKNILYRKKQGFPTPLAMMFQGELNGYVSQIIDSELAYNRGYFKKSEVQKLLKEHSDGSKDHHKILWQLLVLELWHREYIDTTTTP